MQPAPEHNAPGKCLPGNNLPRAFLDLAESEGFEKARFRNSLCGNALQRNILVFNNLPLSSVCIYFPVFSGVCPLAWPQFGHKVLADCATPRLSAMRNGYSYRPALTPICPRRYMEPDALRPRAAVARVDFR